MAERERKPRKGDIGFWTYNGYPYVLSGTVVGVAEQQDDGRWVATIDEYGTGRFTLLFSLPKRQGRIVSHTLAELREEHRERLDEARRISATRLRSTIEDLNIPTNKFQDYQIRNYAREDDR